MNAWSKCRDKNQLLLSSVKNMAIMYSIYQCTSSESVKLAASAELVDLDEDYSIQTADPDAEPTLAKRRKLIKDHQGNSIVKLQCKFIIWPSCSLTLGNSHDFYKFNIVALDRLIFIFVSSQFTLIPQKNITLKEFLSLSCWTTKYLRQWQWSFKSIPPPPQKKKKCENKDRK